MVRRPFLAPARCAHPPSDDWGLLASRGALRARRGERRLCPERASLNMPCKHKLVVFGAGRHAKVVLDVLERTGRYAVVGLLDNSRELYGTRSEERRVGKSVDLGGRRIIKKKKKGAGVSGGVGEWK